MRRPRCSPWPVALGALLVARGARAQTADAATGDATVVTENVLAPGPGRVPVVVEAARAGPLSVGLAVAPPSAPRRGARFDADAALRFCTTPCTLYLRPGPRRIFADTGSEFAWSTDVVVPASGRVRVRLHGHVLGLSAAGGGLFMVGLLAAVGGPTLLIVNGVVGTEPRLAPPVWAVGISMAVGGALAVAGGVALVNLASPRVESVGASGAARAPVGPAWALLPAVSPEGAALVAALRF